MSIRDYLINKILDIKEFDIITDIQDEELTTLNTAITNILDNEFISTANEIGIARREKLLKIQPYADDTLESRKFRIQAKWNDKLPYTHRQLINKLNSLVGTNGYVATINYASYILNIKINLGQKRMIQDVNSMIKNMSPANLIVTVELQYNRHVDLAQFTHFYLNAKTHTELREEVL